MKRRITAGLLALVTVLATASAAQASPRISLSRDGHHWTSALEGQLFPDDTKWVPGDRRIETFYVRNDSDEPAELILDLRNTAVQDLYDTGDLTISARSEGPWQSINGSEDRRILEQTAAEAGKPRRVDVAVTFSKRSLNQSQVLRLKLAFAVRLVEDTDGDGIGNDRDTDTGSGTDGGGSGASGGGRGSMSVSGSTWSDLSLPDTGSPLDLMVPVVGAMCLLAGIVLAGSPRRREVLR